MLKTITLNRNRGINRFANPLNMSPEYLWDCLNGYINRENDIQQRSGIAKFNSTAIAASLGAFTVTIASPGVITLAAHGFVVGDSFYATTTGTLPTGMSVSTTYYVTTVVSSSTFQFSATRGGTAINTSGSQSGTHTLYSLVINYLYEAKWDSGVKNMIARCGGAWWKEDADAVWDSLDAGRVANAQGQAVMMSNTLVMVDGGVARKSTSAWSVSDLTTDGSAPTDPTAVHIHNHHLILNSATNPLKVYISALNSLTDFSTAKDALILDLRVYIKGGDTIIGFDSVGEDYLVIKMKRHIVIFNASKYTVDWTLQQIIPTGAITNYGGAFYSKQLFIPGLEGINTFTTLAQTGEEGVADITRSIAPLYRDYIDDLTSTNWKYINGGISRKLNHYYICFPLSAGHEIIVYSFDHNAVVGRFTGYSMYSFCEREDGTVLIGGGLGYAYTMNSGTNDDGTAISFELLTPYYYLGDEEHYKVVRRFEAVVDHSAAFTFYLDYAWDTQAGATITKTVAIASLNRTVVKTEDVLGRGRAIMFKIYHATKDVLITISRWSISFVKEGIR